MCELGLINQINVASITIDDAFTTRCSRFLHAKQESEIMMILTSVLANLGHLPLDRCIWSHSTALLDYCATGGATNQSRATDILRRYLLALGETCTGESFVFEYEPK